MRLLPERFLRSSEQVVEQTANCVGDGVRIEIVVQRVVADTGVEADLEVVPLRFAAANMVRNCWQKSPLTSRTSPPTLRSGSCARHRTSCSTNGYMHAGVFLVPTAPRIITPVYRPRCGIVSQDGLGARPGVVAKCASPRTSIGAARDSGSG